MHRRLLAMATLLLGLGVVAGAAIPASAGEGPVDYAACTIAVDPATFAAGSTVTVVGTGLQPNFETIIEFNSVTVQVGTAMTDASGSFETTVQIPADATPGAHTITAVCDAIGNTSGSDVSVSSTGGPGGGSGGGSDGGSTGGSTGGNGGGNNLARTGSDTEPLLVAAGVALLAGTAFVLVAKRRRSTASA